MYLRRYRKEVNGEEYAYWSLVESIRTARGPRQRIVATIGKLPELDKEERIGWEDIGRILTGKSQQQDGLFEKAEELPLWATVDINGVSVERLRSFGDIYLALLLWHRLGFTDFCKEHIQVGETFDFLFYDITSTYFEGVALGNPQAVRGYSRDSRPDCPQVCIGLVTSREGLPLAFEIFDGNRVDVTTMEEMVEIMESKYGKANRIWVMDRGMVSEENIEFMKGRAVRYLVGTPKSMLKKFEEELLEKGWEEVQHGIEVKIIGSSNFCLFFIAGDVENPSAVDEDSGTRHCTEKTY
jgi:hypothetical protein